MALMAEKEVDYSSRRAVERSEGYSFPEDFFPRCTRDS